MRRSWTDEDLRAAVACSKNYKATLERLGLSPRGGNHYEIKSRIRVLGLDVSHFRQSQKATYPWTEEQLRVAVIDAASQVQVLERLGVAVEVRYLAKLARHVRFLGLHITNRGWKRRDSSGRMQSSVKRSRPLAASEPRSVSSGWFLPVATTTRCSAESVSSRSIQRTSPEPAGDEG